MSNTPSAQDPDPDRRDADDISASMLEQIEEFIAEGAMSDALNVLLDMARDFAPDETGSVLQLLKRLGGTRERLSREGVLSFRESILGIAYRIDDTQRMSPQESIEEEFERAGEGLKQTQENVVEAALEISTANSHASSKAGTHSSIEVAKQYLREFWSDPSAVAVEAEGVSKSFHKDGFTLKPISFQIRLGEIVGIVGRNASGKTTLLRMLMGELAPDAGSIRYPGLRNGDDGHHSLRDKIGFVPQLPEKWHGRLRHNLNFMAASSAWRKNNLERDIDWCVERYNLGEYENARWDEISGGYKVRFELVRAMSCQPKLLILDEPLAYLDVIARQTFLNDLQTIAIAFNRPTPVVVTSQHLNEIEAIADQIIFLVDGEPRFVGALDSIAKSANFRVVEVSLPVARTDLTLALSGLAVADIEQTMEGYIISFAKHTDIGEVFKRLYATFGEKFSAIRDITGSVRSLMREDQA